MLEEEIASASEGGSPQYYEDVPNKVAISHFEKSYIHSYFFQGLIEQSTLEKLDLLFYILATKSFTVQF